ncbi:hypothetical protein HIM_07317 [Hirsutella minnesotensis 3608]|uniref:Uncharacterized protein n=1 Tax=Hirsutella minnesotensis 3608 TaxID=1043627 RepID=A0A0F7ZTL3_9HYPO|nr:hypothetical protein HIM_07317 [Hirsutella minnesotensis 3608]
MGPTQIQIDQNKAIIEAQPGVYRSLYVKANAKTPQFVTVRVDDVDYNFSGTGEYGTVIGYTQLPPAFHRLEVISQYALGEDRPEKLPSKAVRNAPPTRIETLNSLVLVCENGDDDGYNDVLVELMGYSP